MAAGLNKVMIIGNLGSDPEMSYTSNGTARTTMRVAVNRNFTTRDGDRREETEWFSVVAWDKLGEIVSQYLTKGRRVYVEGRLQTRQYDDKEGQRRYFTEVVAQDVQFLDRAQGDSAQGVPFSEGGDSAPAASGGAIAPDDLPFE